MSSAMTMRQLAEEVEEVMVVVDNTESDHQAAIAPKKTGSSIMECLTCSWMRINVDVILPFPSADQCGVIPSNSMDMSVVSNKMFTINYIWSNTMNYIWSQGIQATYNIIFTA
jgi:hypothetical protein